MRITARASVLFATALVFACTDDTRQPTEPETASHVINNPPGACVGCVVNATIVRDGPVKWDRITFTADTAADYLLEAQMASGASDFLVRIFVSGQPEIRLRDYPNRVDRVVQSLRFTRANAVVEVRVDGRAGTALTLVVRAGARLIGPSGGTVRAPSGASVQVPAGALPQSTPIALAPDAQASTGTLPPVGLSPAGTPVVLGPEGTTFALPVVVRLPYDPSALGSANETQVGVAYLDPSTSEVELADSWVDSSANVVYGVLWHFSTSVPIVTGSTTWPLNTVPTKAYYWDVDEITYYIEPDPGALVWGVRDDAVANAVESWLPHQGRFSMRRVFTRSSANLVLFLDPDCLGCEARTNTFWRSLSPVPIRLSTGSQVTIQFLATQNAAQNTWASTLYLLATVRHEVGHALGLGHATSDGSHLSPTGTQAMWVPPFYCLLPLCDAWSNYLKFRDATITGDDIAALQSLYGPPLADLEVASAAAPGPLVAGQRVTSPFYAVRNSGGVAVSAGSYVTRFYLSADANITTSDIQVGGTTNTPALAAGATSPLINDNVDVPANLTPGQYYFGVIVDPLNTVAESDETNNVGMVAGAVTVSAPAVGWCGADLSFDGGVLPSGWSLLQIRGGPGLVSNRLEGRPTDSGAWVLTAGAATAGSGRVVVEFDAEHRQNIWGMGPSVVLETGTAYVQAAAATALFNFGANRIAIGWNSGLPPMETGQGSVIGGDTLSYTYGIYRHSVEFTNTASTWTIRTPSGQQVSQASQALPGWFNLANVTRFGFQVYTTTEQPFWADNLSIRCY